LRNELTPGLDKEYRPSYGKSRPFARGKRHYPGFLSP